MNSYYTTFFCIFLILLIRFCWSSLLASSQFGCHFSKVRICHSCPMQVVTLWVTFGCFTTSRPGAAWRNWTMSLKPVVRSWGGCRYLQLQESPKSRLGKLGPTWPVKPVICCPPCVSLGVCERLSEGKLLKLVRQRYHRKEGRMSELASNILLQAESIWKSARTINDNHCSVQGGDEEVLTTLLGQHSRHVFPRIRTHTNVTISWLDTLTGGCASLQQRQWLTARRRQTYMCFSKAACSDGTAADHLSCTTTHAYTWILY